MASAAKVGAIKVTMRRTSAAALIVAPLAVLALQLAYAIHADGIAYDETLYSFLALTALTGVWVVRNRRVFLSTPALLHWRAPAAVVFAAASLSRVLTGERYMLPVDPYLILLTSFAVAPALRTRTGRLVFQFPESPETR